MKQGIGQDLPRSGTMALSEHGTQQCIQDVGKL